MNKESEREYLKKYRQTPQYKEYHDTYMKEYREKHKERLAIQSNKRCHKLWQQNRDSDLHMRRSLLRRAKKRAVYKNLPFDLILDDIVIPEKCPVLGIPLKVQVGRASDGSPSLDRFIPVLGYTKENIRVISNRANKIKGDATLEELKALVCWMEE